MSQADVDLIRSLIPPAEVDLTELVRSDELFSQLAASLDEFVLPEVETVAVWQGGTVRTGMDGLRQAWLDWLEPWAEYHTQVEELIDAGDSVVALVRDRGRREDVEREVDILAGSTWQVDDGKVARVVFYGNREDALTAAGVEQR
jgi:ketosteroid isomerase-like protein